LIIFEGRVGQVFKWPLNLENGSHFKWGILSLI
jgi:hypothetical protein